MTNEAIVREFGLQIRNRRLSRGFSQDELAIKSGLHHTYISKLECGLKAPTILTMMKICDALNISLNDLLSDFSSVDFSDDEHNRYPLKCYKLITTLSPAQQEKIYKIVLAVVNLCD
ncbi:helix-turn-helix domain-containing protein [Butyrivibrio sp. VCD2006]|uniref:helix-turn-helix domain-containing protein n=1 Tax=Butyrivibrio sp. VCD2006 TaxID=1280664 RepID=UPI0004295EA8|nr:helix-turn-helix transcriptional regulator [Butyrivibrio sp. VCD2006]